MRLIIYTPLILTILILLICILPYILAVANGHVDPIFPYVSDAGAIIPQAAYFSILLFSAAIMTGALGFYRYQQIKCVFNDQLLAQQTDIPNPQYILKANTIAFFLSMILMMSLAAVGAFRASEMVIIHILVASPIFLVAPLILLIQAWISHKLLPITGANPVIVVKLRVAFVVLAGISGFVSGAFALWSVVELKPPLNQLDFDTRAKWRHEFGGYVAHCVSAAGEWLAFVFMAASIATFCTELARFKLHRGGVMFIHNDNNNETKV